MSTRTITVSGMTCGHCVRAVKEELAKLSGVTDVDVQLDDGKVTITSEADLDADEVRAAIDEAGYEVVS